MAFFTGGGLGRAMRSRLLGIDGNDVTWEYALELDRSYETEYELIKVDDRIYGLGCRYDIMCDYCARRLDPNEICVVLLCCHSFHAVCIDSTDPLPACKPCLKDTKKC